MLASTEPSVYQETLDLLDEVDSELADERFLGRTHAKVATHKAGCTGPLCRWAERKRGLHRYHEQKAKEGTPVIEERAKPARRFDELLSKLALEHWDEKLDQAS